jgi:RHS repeat-associated protein
MRYTGKELDDEEIIQHYFGARYLDDATLRFTSIDPQEGKYPGWSPYSYALANPMRLVDSDGEFVILAPILAGLTAFVGSYIFDANTANAPMTADEPVIPGRTGRDEAVDVAFGVFLGGVGGDLGEEAAKGVTREVLGETAEAASKSLSKAERLAINHAEGRAKEALYRSKHGLAKNTKPVTGTEGTSIPDVLNSAQPTEIKASKYVSRTKQIRIQQQVAQKTGRTHKLAIGTTTRAAKSLERLERKGLLIIERDEILNP